MTPTRTKKAGKLKPQVGYGLRSNNGNIFWDVMDARLSYLKATNWAEPGERWVKVRITYTEIKPKRKVK